MKTLIEQIKARDSYAQFNSIPGRLFLDTNVLQYLQDFGEYIFDNYRDSDDYFQIGGKTIRKGERLFHEIEALHDFFINVNRAHFEFALSEAVYHEVVDKGDSSFIQWFFDVWDHWESVIVEYEAGSAFFQEAEKHYQMALNDKSLYGSLSKKDHEIVLDAIRFDSDALLTVDRFARDQNKKMYVFQNYGLMILTPSEFLEIIKPFQNHWC